MEARIDSRFARVLVAGTATMALAAGMAALVPATAQAKSAKPSVKITAKAATYDGEAYDGGVKVVNKSDATIYYATGKTKLNYKNYKTAGDKTAPTRTKAGSTTVKWIAVPKNVKKVSIFNTRTGSYRIKVNAVSLRSDAVDITKASEEAAYTGKNADPGISVKWGEKELKKGTEYTVKYANAVKPSGKYSYATATITGKGNFKSSKTVKYRVVADAQVTHANGAKEYKGKLADAINNATSGDKIKMLRDVEVVPEERQYAKTTMTLDLNGYKMFNTRAIDAAHWSWFIDVSGGDLTITDSSAKGTGTMTAMKNDCYVLNVSDGGKLTVKGGSYVGNVTCVQVAKGSAVIEGGHFSLDQTWPIDDQNALGTKYLLNLIDDAAKDGTGVISVKGGSFENFNPDNTVPDMSEDKAANYNEKSYLATGYKVVTSVHPTASNVTVYTVTKA